MESKMFRTGGGVQTSVIVSVEFYQLCKKFDIKFSKALRVGIALLLAERGVKDYDNSLSLHRKMLLFKNEAEKALQELEKLQKKDI